jgi:hypothetical protein
VEADGDRILGFTSFLCRRWRGHGRRTDCNDLRITLHGPSRSNPDSPNLRGGAQCVVFVRSLRSEISQRD